MYNCAVLGNKCVEISNKCAAVKGYSTQLSCS